MTGTRVVFVYEGDQNQDLNIFDFKADKIVQSVPCYISGEKPSILLPLSEIIRQDMIDETTKKRNGVNLKGFQS